MDVAVLSTRSQQADLDFGYGLQATEGGAVDLERVAFLENRRAALVASGAGTGVALRELRVEDTLERECAAAGCAGEGPGGSGLVALGGAAVEATGFLVSGHPLAGVQLVEAGTIDLHEGLVAHNLVGANVQTEDFDLDRLRDRVVFRDNERTLDSSSLPAPEVVGGLAP